LTSTNGFEKVRAAMKSYIFGHTQSGLPLMAYDFGNEGPRVFILGGVHGDEIEGVWAAFGLLKSFSENFPFKLKLTLLPVLNLDGVLTRERKNSRGIDLNRNLPSKDWTSEVATPRYNPGTAALSESENQCLVRFLEDAKPHLIISLHSWKPMLNINGDCLPEAQAISHATGYVVEETIGYPTPGCLGTFAGLERGWPTLTYEIERGLDLKSVLDTHVPAILQGLKACAARGRK
jgi:protein MpaA